MECTIRTFTCADKQRRNIFYRRLVWSHNFTFLQIFLYLLKKSNPIIPLTFFFYLEPQKFSKDGYEEHMQVNHLAPALLSVLLLPSLIRGSPSRIVNVNSIVSFIPIFFFFLFFNYPIVKKVIIFFIDASSWICGHRRYECCFREKKVHKFSWLLKQQISTGVFLLLN